MKKIMTLAILGFVGLATQANAKVITHEMWVPWRCDECKAGINADVEKCYKALYCPRGHERKNMTHDVYMHTSSIGPNWKEHFTSCRADCVPDHPELH